MDPYPALFVKMSFVCLPLGVTLGLLMGDRFRVHSAARAVLERRFGAQIFSRRGIDTEALAQSAQMHGADPTALPGEMKAAMLAVEPGTGAAAR